MLIAVAVLAIASIAALIAAMMLDSGVIAAGCAGMCVVALLVLIIDARRAPRRTDPMNRLHLRNITTPRATNCSASTTFNVTWSARSGC